MSEQPSATQPYWTRRKARACGNKRKYATRDAARKAARKVQREHGRQRPYKCDFCGGYHIGHSSL